MVKKIYIANDHAAVDLKNILVDYLKSKGIEVINLGTDTKDSVHYPEYAKKLAQKILSDEEALGILMCGTGIGMSISINRYKGIRAALCYNEYTAKMARAHNNANVLVMGGRVVGPELAKSIVDTFLDGEFEGGRHQIRIDMIDELVE